MVEEIGDRFAVVGATDGLGQDRADVDRLNARALGLDAVVRTGVGDLPGVNRQCRMGEAGGRERDLPQQPPGKTC